MPNANGMRSNCERTTMSTTLISVEQLQQNLTRPDWRVIDCRHDLMDFSAGLRAYRAGHIPGALFASTEDELAGPKTGTNGRHPLPDRAALVETFRRWGIDNDTQIVAYDEQGSSFAVRLWFLARWLGHEKVAVLDGGWPAWRAKGGASSTAEPVVARGSFTEGPSLVRVVDTAQVLARAGDPATLLLDVRSAERFRGEVEPIDPVAGHIPGAHNRFWQQNLTSAAEGTYKSAATLRAELEAELAGRDPSVAIVHCGSGVTSCHLLLAFEIAGLSGAALYAGSWSEWIADPARPVATGA